ncbi:hypothetical protein Q5762_10910 [Streptomyces sp. P9(2023)]|nr:hypothetical protein [Streptomyces sp. P9(2023)]
MQRLWQRAHETASFDPAEGGSGGEACSADRPESAIVVDADPVEDDEDLGQGARPGEPAGEPDIVPAHRLAVAGGELCPAAGDQGLSLSELVLELVPVAGADDELVARAWSR